MPRPAGATSAGSRIVGAMVSDGNTFSAIVLDEEGGFGSRLIDKLALISFVFTRR